MNNTLSLQEANNKIKQLVKSKKKVVCELSCVKITLKKLQREHDVLLSQVNYKEQSKLVEIEKQNKKLQEQIKVLKFQLENQEHQRENNSEIFKEVIEENKKLKEENEQFKRRWEMFNVEEKLEEKLVLVEYGSEEIRTCIEENKKLKEQLKKQ